MAREKVGAWVKKEYLDLKKQQKSIEKRLKSLESVFQAFGLRIPYSRRVSPALKEKERTTFKCKFCPERFDTRKGRDIHIGRVHKNKK